jgi:prolyl oligopeptidase
VIDYPDSRRSDVVETLHGQRIPDPYRWLEDPESAETVDWVRRQNEVTEAHLHGLPDRGWFRETMRAVLRRPRAGTPSKRGGHYFVKRNDGSQDQDVWYVADTLEDLLQGGRVIVDPNTFSTTGTDSLGSFTVSDDGHYFAYTLSEGGSDWTTFVLLDLATGQQVDDAVIQTKFSEPVWLPDSTSYLYTDFAHAGHAAGTQTDTVGGGRLRLHRVGRPQTDDELILEFEDNDQLIATAEVSADGRYVVVTIAEGTENRNRLWVYPITGQDGVSTLAAPVKLVDEVRAEFHFVRSVGSTLLLQTDLDAPRGRLVSCDLSTVTEIADAAADVTFSELIPQAEGTLISVLPSGEHLITVSLVDAQPRLVRHALDGTAVGPVEVSGGALIEHHTQPGDPEGFLGFSSVTSPTTAYRVDADTGEVRALPELVQGSAGSFRPPEVRAERRRATSVDGTPVPYFLVTRSDLDLSSPRPTLLYGYGGFKIPVLADYRPGWSGWLAAGGVLVIANLRGGGEFGTEWYDAGRLAAKQNVFDDFIAVVEHLVAAGVTTAAQLALHGRSNGGLLVGAVMTQRPDLAAVALPAVGVLDLLRFHRFTIGAAWMSDYGNPDDPHQFADALAYSPLHRVRPGIRYPATLVLTGDHDDRVVPLHSHKFTATLQHAQAAPAPVLTRIEVATGHGAGKPAAMVADEWADLLAFAAHHTGLTPSTGSGDVTTSAQGT